MPEPVTIDKFGEDHWNMLMHVETRCTDWAGFLDRNGLRLNGVERPTVLKGGNTVPGHSDLHCIRDLAAAGLVEDKKHLHLTELGWRILSEIRKHFAAGGDLDGFEPSGALPLLGEEKRALHWIIGGDTGVSSMAIWAVMMDQVEPGTQGVSEFLVHDVPKDAGDFGRCHRLLEFIPEWKRRLHEVGEAIPRWQPFVREWKAMEDLHLKSRDMSAPLEQLLNEGESIEDRLRDASSTPGTGG